MKHNNTHKTLAIGMASLLGASFGAFARAAEAQEPPPAASLQLVDESGFTNLYDTVEDTLFPLGYALGFAPETQGMDKVLEITGIPAGSDINDHADGTYDETTGIYTRVFSPNVNTISSAISFTPPADSDEDFNMTATVTVTDPATGLSSSTAVPVPVEVDAEADVPNITVNNVGVASGATVSLDITANPTDLDGSEEITALEISGIPAGASLNLGQDLGGGTWLLEGADLDDLATLEMTLPADVTGTVSLGATAYAEEVNLSGVEADTSNNTNANTVGFSVEVIPNCPAQPDPSCLVAGKASLKIKDYGLADPKNQLQVKLGKLPDIDRAELGDPVDGDTSYTLCLYDTSSGTPALAFDAKVASGGLTAKGKPFWKNLNHTGVMYKDSKGDNPDKTGLTKVLAKAGINGKAKIDLQGKGSDLSLPGAFSAAAEGGQYFELDPSITAQVRVSDGLCVSATFTGSDKPNKNDPMKPKFSCDAKKLGCF